MNKLVVIPMGTSVCINELPTNRWYYKSIENTLKFDYSELIEEGNMLLFKRERDLIYVDRNSIKIM